MRVRNSGEGTAGSLLVCAEGCRYCSAEVLARLALALVRRTPFFAMSMPLLVLRCCSPFSTPRARSLLPVLLQFAAQDVCEGNRKEFGDEVRGEEQGGGAVAKGCGSWNARSESLLTTSMRDLQISPCSHNLLPPLFQTELLRIIGPPNPRLVHRLQPQPISPPLHLPPLRPKLPRQYFSQRTN